MFANYAAAHALALLTLIGPGDPGSTPGLTPDQGPQDRLERIEIDLSGTAGTIVTSPVLMTGKAGSFEFGDGVCRAHKLAPAVLEQLHLAMRSRQPVRIAARSVKGPDATQIRCVERISFFPPRP